MGAMEKMSKSTSKLVKNIRGIIVFLERKLFLLKKVIGIVVNYIIYYTLISKFCISNIYRKSSGINTKPRSKNIIISLTTYPERFDCVYLTIESLLSQSIKPDEIILCLSNKEIDENLVPKKIEKLQKRGLSIKFTSTNLKSYQKLICVLDMHKDSLIITVDDDTIYPKHFVKGLMEKSKQNPNCVVAYRCSYIRKLNDEQLTPYLSWDNASWDKPSFNLFPTGCGGILYPPYSLSEEVFNEDIFLRLCPSGDDIWFKAMALLNGTKTVMVFNQSVEFPTVLNSQKKALWHQNVNEQKND